MTAGVARRPSGVRRGRALRRIAITLLILLILLIAADRVGDAVAENEAAKTIQSSQHLASRPDVSIDGVPFLTQLIVGNFGKITINAKNVPIQSTGHTLNVAELDVVLHDLSVSRNFSSFRAHTATASALITYGDLGSTFQSTLTYLGAGRVKAQTSVSFLGRSYTASVSAKPVLVGQSISFQSPHVEGAGGLTSDVVRLLDGVFNRAVALTGFPFGVQVQSLTVDATGVHAVLGGRDIYFSH